MQEIAAECTAFTNIEYVSDHYPISITLDTNLLCNTSNKLAVGRKVLLWSKSDEWQKQYYRSELDKLLDINLSKTIISNF
jgi:hypothetical protein